MAQNTETPPETLKAATEEDALKPHALTLVGTMDKPEGSLALIRTPTGEIRKVAPGDQLGRALVTAIEPGILHLSHGGRSRKLTLPGGG